MSMTHSVPAIATMAVCGLITLLLPVLLYALVRARTGARLSPLWLGAATFLVLSLVLYPLAAELLSKSLFVRNTVQPRWWADAIYRGLLAGILERTGMLCAFYFILKKGRSNNLGGTLCYGAGYGGLQAVLLCTLPMTAGIALQRLGSTPVLEQLLAAPLFRDAFVQTAGGPLSAQWFVCLLRIVTFAFAVAASLLVWMAATGRGPWGVFFLAILLHTVVEFPLQAYRSGALKNGWIALAATAALTLAVCFGTARAYEKCAQFYTPLLPYQPKHFQL